MMNQKKGEHIKMNTQKKLGKNTELDKTITNKIHNTNYGVSSQVIQVFRDELPKILERLSLKHRIEFLQDFIPKITENQMKLFAINLQDAYIRILISERLRKE